VQTLLFSATIPAWVNKVHYLYCTLYHCTLYHFAGPQVPAISAPSPPVPLLPRSVPLSRSSPAARRAFLRFVTLRALLAFQCWPTRGRSVGAPDRGPVPEARQENR